MCHHHLFSVVFFDDKTCLISGCGLIRMEFNFKCPFTSYNKLPPSFILVQRYKLFIKHGFTEAQKSCNAIFSSHFFCIDDWCMTSFWYVCAPSMDWMTMKCIHGPKYYFIWVAKKFKKLDTNKFTAIILMKNACKRPNIFEGTQSN